MGGRAKAGGHAEVARDMKKMIKSKSKPKKGTTKNQSKANIGPGSWTNIREEWS